MATETYGNVCFAEDTWTQLREYTELCPVEVACMGYAKLDGNNVVVDEVFLVPQVVSGASVEFVETGFPYAVQKAITDGRLADLKFCWHSHVNFTAHFSSIDEEMVRKVRDHAPIDWFANVVLNKKGDTYARIDYFDLGPGVEEFCQHVKLGLDVMVDGQPLHKEELRIEELEQFLTPRKEETKSTTPSTGAGAAESVGASGCTAKDWKLHNLAKEKGWEAYIDPEHYAHYWDASDKTYKGCAPMPKNSDGSYKIEVNETVKDAASVEALDDFPGQPLDQVDEDHIERLTTEVMERGQG
jgi:hypothetical protein